LNFKSRRQLKLFPLLRWRERIGFADIFGERVVRGGRGICGDEKQEPETKS